MPEIVLTPKSSVGARSERIHLNPSEVAGPDRIEIDLHAGPIQVREQGIDWGSAEIEAFMAQAQYGQKPVDFRLPNRVITIPLILGATGDFDEGRIALQAEASRINEEGGTLKREIIGGTYGEAGDHLFCDLVKATLKLTDDTPVASEGFDPNAELILEALPDFYGDPIELAALEGTGDASQAFQINGNLPGRADMRVSELGGVDQHAFLWHFRCRDYLSAPEAAWAMAVEKFEVIGAGEKVTLAGSASPKVVKHKSLSTQWTGIASRTLTHRGIYAVWVRVWTGAVTLPFVRLVYDAGDLIAPTENPAVQIPGNQAYYILYLGQVNLREAPIGTYRWKALLQARGLKGNENIYFDRIWFLNTTESSGTPTAPKQRTAGLAASLVVDGFNQAAGAATGAIPDVGSAYVVLTNSDTTPDFQVDFTNRLLTRASTSDSGTIASGLPGRAIGSGVLEYTNSLVAHDILNLPPLNSVQTGHIVRWISAGNFAATWVEYSSEAPNPGFYLQVAKVTAGVVTSLGTVLLSLNAANYVGRLETMLNGGELSVYISGVEKLTVRHEALATGGSLAKGRTYLYDGYAGATEYTRQYDNFEISPISLDAVNFASRSARLRWDGLYRLGPDGVSAGPMPRQGSDLPRIPVSGPEERPVEVAVKTSRGDLGLMADSGVDPFSVALSYRPCWSDVPVP